MLIVSGIITSRAIFSRGCTLLRALEFLLPATDRGQRATARALVARQSLVERQLAAAAAVVAIGTRRLGGVRGRLARTTRAAGTGAARPPRRRHRDGGNRPGGSWPQRPRHRPAMRAWPHGLLPGRCLGTTLRVRLGLALGGLLGLETRLLLGLTALGFLALGAAAFVLRDPACFLLLEEPTGLDLALLGDLERTATGIHLARRQVAEDRAARLAAAGIGVAGLLLRTATIVAPAAGTAVLIAAASGLLALIATRTAGSLSRAAGASAILLAGVGAAGLGRTVAGGLRGRRRTLDACLGPRRRRLARLGRCRLGGLCRSFGLGLRSDGLGGSGRLGRRLGRLCGRCFRCLGGRLRSRGCGSRLGSRRGSFRCLGLRLRRCGLRFGRRRVLRLGRSGCRGRLLSGLRTDLDLGRATAAGLRRRRRRRRSASPARRKRPAAAAEPQPQPEPDAASDRPRQPAPPAPRACAIRRFLVSTTTFFVRPWLKFCRTVDCSTPPRFKVRVFFVLTLSVLSSPDLVSLIYASASCAGPVPAPFILPGASLERRSHVDHSIGQGRRIARKGVAVGRSEALQPRYFASASKALSSSRACITGKDRCMYHIHPTKRQTHFVGSSKAERR